MHTACWNAAIWCVRICRKSYEMPTGTITVARSSSSRKVEASYAAARTPQTADRMSGMTNMLKIEDARTRKIIESHLKLSKRRLERHLTTELPFTTQAALECGLITEIRDFSVPSGQMLSNI